MTQAVRNAADATQVKDARRIEVDREKQWASDLLTLASDPAGQRILRRLLTFSTWLETGLGPTDALTNFRAGKREVALWLIAELTRHAPAAIGPILTSEPL